MRKTLRILYVISSLGLLAMMLIMKHQNGLQKSRLLFSNNFRSLYAPTKAMDRGPYKSGDLVFSEEFEQLNSTLWESVVTISSCGNMEFQIYDKHKENAYIENGVLHIRPTLTAEKYGNEFLHSCTLELEGCTDTIPYFCKKIGGEDRIINPVLSARLRTRENFAFLYGKVEARMRIPSADWTWPAIWLLPQDSFYGVWPQSGEVDVLEARGNSHYYDPRNWKHIGNQQLQASLHYGLSRRSDQWRSCHTTRNLYIPYSYDFHTVQFNWFPGKKCNIQFDQLLHILFADLLSGVDRFEFGVNNEIIKVCGSPTEDGMYEMGRFSGYNIWTNLLNPTLAPFDRFFYFTVNVAVGGMRGFFDDKYINLPYGKPWSDIQRHESAMKSFCRERHKWLPSWENNRSKQNFKLITLGFGPSKLAIQ